MSRSKKQGAVALILLLLIFLFQRIPAWSNFYAREAYPALVSVLSGFSSFFPFSLYDLFIVIAILGMTTGLICLFFRRTRKKAFFALLSGVVWLYIAFYALWGINYFAPDFASRNQLHRQPFDSLQFQAFLSDYTENLNASYTLVPLYSAATLDSLIRQAGQKMDGSWDFPKLPASCSVKPMLSGKLYAAMGIRGYYGPFFAEAHVNPLYLPHERPSITAHELGHLAGITSEADANLFSFLLTTGSDDPAFRFSGYYSLLPYVLSNARRLLSDNDYDQFTRQIDPRVKALYQQSRNYWYELYSHRLGSVQDWFYEMYLKGNNIPSGTANYSEVIGILIGLRQKQLSDK